MNASRPTFTIDETGGATHIRMIRGSATPSALSDFGAVLTQLVSGGTQRPIIVDLSEVDFMPTAMLGHLIAANTKLRARGGRIRLVGVNDHIRGVFEVTRMKDHFDFHTSKSTAGSAPLP